MIQINNGYEEYYYLQEDGAIRNGSSSLTVRIENSRRLQFREAMRTGS